MQCVLSSLGHGKVDLEQSEEEVILVSLVTLTVFCTVRVCRLEIACLVHKDVERLRVLAQSAVEEDNGLVKGRVSTDPPQQR